MELPAGEHINWADIAAYFGAGISALLTIIFSITHKRIEAKADAVALTTLIETVKAKADAEAVISLAEAVRQKANMELVTSIMTRIDQMLSGQREDSNHQREDARLIYASIKEIAEAQQSFAQKAIEELGKRPTRDEMGQSFERRKS